MRFLFFIFCKLHRCTVYNTIVTIRPVQQLQISRETPCCMSKNWNFASVRLCSHFLYILIVIIIFFLHGIKQQSFSIFKSQFKERTLQFVFYKYFQLFYDKCFAFPYVSYKHMCVCVCVERINWFYLRVILPKVEFRLAGKTTEHLICRSTILVIVNF